MRELIFFPINKVKPKGGPAGYLYNLKQELHKSHIQIDFLPEESEFPDNKRLRNLVPSRIKDIRRVFSFIRILKKGKNKPENLNDYDAIHFHSTEDLYLCRNWLKEYKGKVILTSHSPCIYHKELINRLNPIDAKFFAIPLKKLEILDIYSFERADYIIFPCKEAEEPYFHTWDKYSMMRSLNKYRYVPTGIVGCMPKIGRKDIRRKYKIPDDAFVISYVGRHNEIKGYSDLKKLGGSLLENSNVYFLIAGKESPLNGLKHNRWIEVGWTNDPHSIIAASDIFVLPNRETYFDLILLEVISLGIPVVLSETGGNKYFKQFNLSGIKFFTTLEMAKQKIYEIEKLTNTEIYVMKKQLICLFNEEFSIEKFGHRYFETINDIISK